MECDSNKTYWCQKWNALTKSNDMHSDLGSINLWQSADMNKPTETMNL